MTRGASWFGIVLMACGGAQTPPPEAPSGAPAEESTEAAPKEEGPKEEAAPKEESPKEEAAESTSGSDLEKVIQLVIDDAELEQYLKLGQPGRFPLKVSGENLSGLTLTKGTKPVEIVAAPKDAKDAVLVITKVELDGARGTIGYRYDAEGIRGTANVEKGKYGWELKNSRIVER